MFRLYEAITKGVRIELDATYFSRKFLLYLLEQKAMSEGDYQFMLDMFKNATISERDSILLNRAAEYGMLTKDAAAYLCKVDSYLYRGMLSDVRGRDLAEDDFRWVTREFMDLIIRGYMTQLEEGCSILVVKPDFVAAKSDSDVDARSSYRVKIIPMEHGTAKHRRKATA